MLGATKRVGLLALLCGSLVPGCGDNGGTSDTGQSGTSTMTSMSTSTTAGSGTQGGGTPCSTQSTQQACEGGDPGNGQVCDWVQLYPAMAEGEPPTSLMCTFGDPSGICVQQLGSEGGTPFGSCGGDGSVPLYWRMQGDGTIEVLESDGFFTPDGWNTCDCHDGVVDEADPLECCCPCVGYWPP